MIESKSRKTPMEMLIWSSERTRGSNFDGQRVHYPVSAAAIRRAERQAARMAALDLRRRRTAAVAAARRAGRP